MESHHSEHVIEEVIRKSIRGVCKWKDELWCLLVMLYRGGCFIFRENLRDET